MSTCPLEKDQVTSGEWELIVIGNNGAAATDAPIAFVRTFSISAGPQQTVSVTPTVTVTVSTTPTAFATNTSTVYTTTKVSAKTTIVEPAKTYFTTVTPSPVTSTSVKTVTRTFNSYTHTRTIVTSTIIPSCTVPPRQSYPDPPCQANHWPKNFPLPPGLRIPGINARRDAVRDTPVDPVALRARYNAIKARSAEKRAAAAAGEAKKVFEKRAADAATVTTTVSYRSIQTSRIQILIHSLQVTSPVFNTTTTLTFATTTAYNLTITTDTVTTTLPPKTIYSGVERDTITAPTPTKTIYSVTYTATTTTKTNTATLTHVTTVTPWAVAQSCIKQGGHFGPAWGWN